MIVSRRGLVGALGAAAGPAIAAPAEAQAGKRFGLVGMIKPTITQGPIEEVIPVIGRAWEIQKRLGIHQPMTGYGRLIADLPQSPSI